MKQQSVGCVKKEGRGIYQEALSAGQAQGGFALDAAWIPVGSKSEAGRNLGAEGAVSLFTLRVRSSLGPKQMEQGAAGFANRVLGPLQLLGQAAQVRWSHGFPSLHLFCAVEAVVESVFTYSSVCCVGIFCCVGGLKEFCLSLFLFSVLYSLCTDHLQWFEPLLQRGIIFHLRSWKVITEISFIIQPILKSADIQLLNTGRA